MHTSISKRIQLFSPFYLRRIGFLRLLPQIGQICIIVFISNFCRNTGADSALYGNIPSIYLFGTPAITTNIAKVVPLQNVNLPKNRISFFSSIFFSSSKHAEGPGTNHFFRICLKWAIITLEKFQKDLKSVPCIWPFPENIRSAFFQQ